MSQITANKLYEHAFKQKWNWQKWLPDNVFQYHNLIYRELNSPVELQMGVLLPFIASIAGPKTRGLFLTRPSVLNIFWINVAASGVGKSQSRKRMISEPLKYILENSPHDIVDFEVSKYTRAGIEDKIISTKGYCCVVTDEGTGFFDDLRKKESKHESDLSLLNQLYDGQGDKTTLAQNRERAVPNNSTSMTVSIQQEAFITGLNSIGRTLWLDNGFGERFILTAVQPKKHTYKENQRAILEMENKFPKDLIGRICLEILRHHRDSKILYVLDDKAKELYERIYDKYNSQFNMKYAVEDSDEASSQPILDDEEKSEICVRSKAPEIIGRLTCIIWIYCNAFECIWKGKKFNIPVEITEEYVKTAEEVVNMSYTHSETFSSALFNKHSGLNTTITRPKSSDRSRVVNALIKCPGPLVTVRHVAKNIRNMSTELVRDELQKLHDEGYGWLISKDKMRSDKFVPSSQCCSVFMKPDIAFLKNDFLRMSSDKDVTDNVYSHNYNKSVDDNLIDIIHKYHPHKKGMTNSQIEHTPKIKKTHPPNALDLLDTTNTDKPSLHPANVLEPKVTTPNKVNIKEYELGEGAHVTSAQRIKSKVHSETDIFRSDTSFDDLTPEQPIAPKKTKLVRKYKKSRAGKLIPIRFQEVDHVSETDMEMENKENQPRKLKKSKLAMPFSNSSDTETDVDVHIPYDHTNANEHIQHKHATCTGKYGSIDIQDNNTECPPEHANRNLQNNTTEGTGGHVSKLWPTKKTVRWNRPKVDKPPQVKQDYIPLRRSERIQDIQKAKDNSSSTDIIEPTLPPTGRKRKLSRSQRNKMHLAKKKK